MKMMANAKIFTIPDPQAEDVVLSCHKCNMTAKGKCQQEEMAKREVRQKACS